MTLCDVRRLTGTSVHAQNQWLGKSIACMLQETAAANTYDAEQRLLPAVSGATAAVLQQFLLGTVMMELCLC